LFGAILDDRRLAFADDEHFNRLPGVRTQRLSPLELARKREVTYERQDEEPGTQKVRVWGDTAVVTSLLWIKSMQGDKPADYKLWFSDTIER
jgi:hypothetical protein